MKIVASLLIISLSIIIGVSISLPAYSISTSTESEQPTNQVMAMDELKDDLSSELRSIADMAPLKIDNSEGPFYVEKVNKDATSYLSERFSVGILSGNGAIRLQNSTDLLNFTSTGTEITDSARSAVVSNETIIQESGNESAKVTMFQIAHYRSDDGIPRSAVVATFATNSTGQLATLDGILAIGESELTEGGARQTMLWRVS